MFVYQRVEAVLVAAFCFSKMGAGITQRPKSLEERNGKKRIGRMIVEPVLPSECKKLALRASFSQRKI